MPKNKKGSTLALLSVYQVYELFMKLDARRGPKPPMGPTTTRDPADLNFSIFSLNTSMVTKNKFFTFPARLTPPPGSRSNRSVS